MEKVENQMDRLKRILLISFEQYSIQIGFQSFSLELNSVLMLQSVKR